MSDILTKIVKEEKRDELAKLDAINIVDSLFSDLLDREKDILTRRFGLKGDKKETLEKIGKMHKLTRERVRQIEAASIKKIKKLEDLDQRIADFKEVVRELLEKHGGATKLDYLLDILTVLVLELKDDVDDEKSRLQYKNYFHFLLSNFLDDDVELIKKSDKFVPAVKLKDKTVEHFEELASDLLSNVDGLKKTLSTPEVIDLLKSSEKYKKYKDSFKTSDDIDISKIFKSKVFVDKAEIIDQEKALYSLLKLVKGYKQNKYGEWGKSDWHEIKPKTVNDKIYLVLKHEGKPLHFTEIANKINEMKFDKKKANPATVHNELILDDRYILVDRGTYALKEW